MLWVPQKGIIRVEHNTGAVGDDTPGTAVTTHGSGTSLKGTPVEIFAATAFDAYWVTIMASEYASAATDARGCLDILTGASTEEVLIPDLLFGSCPLFTATSGGWKRWDFPLYIPAGSRIAAQVAGARLSTAVNVQVWLYGGNGHPAYRVGSKVTTYGIGTVPSGTAITPGTTAAEGAWTQISASSSAAHFAFVPSMQLASSDTTVGNRTLAMDIGIGAATEKMIGEGFVFGTDSNEVMRGPNRTFPAFHDVPSGTRLVMRGSNSTAANDAYEVALHAVS